MKGIANFSIITISQSISYPVHFKIKCKMMQPIAYDNVSIGLVRRWLVLSKAIIFEVCVKFGPTLEREKGGKPHNTCSLANSDITGFPGNWVLPKGVDGQVENKPVYLDSCNASDKGLACSHVSQVFKVPI